MEIFLTLLSKVIPLYVIIIMGFLAGKLFHASRDTVGKILFYLVTPMVILGGVINTKLSPSVLFLPFLTFGIGSFLCLLFYGLSKLVWTDSTSNLAAISAGSGNTGYFGLPIAIMLLNEQGEGIYILCLLGVTLYESTVGFYILAKGAHTPFESLMKLLKLPSLYAFILGVIVNFSGLPIPQGFQDLVGYMKGTFTVLGMLVLGLAMAGIHHLNLDYKFIGMTFLAKFVAWPATVLAIIFADIYYLHIFNPTIHGALFLLSIVPLAANTVVLAGMLKSNPEKSATAVFLSTLVALIYIPLMTTYFLEKFKVLD